jgi:hypothetical protein
MVGVESPEVMARDARETRLNVQSAADHTS